MVRPELHLKTVLRPGQRAGHHTGIVVLPGERANHDASVVDQDVDLLQGVAQLLRALPYTFQAGQVTPGS